MQTEKQPFSIASNNNDKKAAIIIDGWLFCQFWSCLCYFCLALLVSLAAFHF